MIDELIQYLAACSSLFLFQFNAHFIGAVISHFNAGKESHEQDSDNEPDYNTGFIHWAVKIVKGGRCALRIVLSEYPVREESIQSSIKYIKLEVTLKYLYIPFIF